MLKKILKILGIVLVVMIMAVGVLYYLVRDEISLIVAITDEDKESFSYYVDEKKIDPNNVYLGNYIQVYMANYREKVDIEFVRFLLDKGVNPNINPTGDLTPLLSAVLLDRKDLVELLIKDKKMDINFSNKKGITPLGGALRLYNCDMSKFLIDKGATLDEDKSQEKLKNWINICKKYDWVSGDAKLIFK
ncbi:MAG: ankyrin repeat domain-containing protein [Alphaproteobacteria bacterium]|nr:ankyrin repeat domain-containing protein [Alphaproteobacteria bacterium]